VEHHPRFRVAQLLLAADDDRSDDDDDDARLDDVIIRVTQPAVPQ